MMNHEFDIDTELVDYLTIIKNIENIGQILPNILHGSMHYKIGVTCVYNGHVIYTLVIP